MLASLNGATRIHVTIGDPIAQVKSPAGITQGFYARGHDAIMIPLQVKAADIDEFFGLAKKLPNLDGIIITVPHKPVAFRHCDTTSERSRVLEVANVMRRGSDDRWSGDMTDGGGFVAALKRNGFDLVVNATPAGMKPGDPLPVDVSRLAQKMLVADIITMPLVTPLLAAAQAKGCHTQNGQQMFDAQVDFICEFLLGKR